MSGHLHGVSGEGDAPKIVHSSYKASTSEHASHVIVSTTHTCGDGGAAGAGMEPHGAVRSELQRAFVSYPGTCKAILY